jgi:hypothetical protein
MEAPSQRDSIRGKHTSLRPAADADLDLLAGWFADSDAYLWWGGEPIGRDRLSADYTGHRSPEVESFIVEAEGIPTSLRPKAFRLVISSTGVQRNDPAASTFSLSRKRVDGDSGPTQPARRRTTYSGSGTGPK